MIPKRISGRAESRGRMRPLAVVARRHLCRPHVACFQRVVNLSHDSYNSKKISSLTGLVLDISTGGVTIKYHLRSVSGSSGPEAKESSPLFGIGPILFAPVSARLDLRNQPVE